MIDPWFFAFIFKGGRVVSRLNKTSTILIANYNTYFDAIQRY